LNEPLREREIVDLVARGLSDGEVDDLSHS